MCYWHPQSEKLRDDLGIHSDLILGVSVRTKGSASGCACQSTECKNLRRARCARGAAFAAGKSFMGGISTLRVRADRVLHPRSVAIVNRFAPPLSIGFALLRDSFGSRNVKLIVDDRIPARIFIHAGGPMTDRLPCDKDWRLYVSLSSHISNGVVW
jgi:hypothetical protein